MFEIVMGALWGKVVLSQDDAMVTGQDRKVVTDQVVKVVMGQVGKVRQSLQPTCYGYCTKICVTYYHRDI